MLPALSHLDIGDFDKTIVKFGLSSNYELGSIIFIGSIIIYLAFDNDVAAEKPDFSFDLVHFVVRSVHNLL